MTSIREREPYRILVIDDNDAIHDDFRKSLTLRRNTVKFSSTKAALFGQVIAEDLANSSVSRLDIDSALQGQEGFNKLLQALRDGRPYQIVFVDMRMPGGWDGVETVQKLLQADPSVQIVVCTAYSDYSSEEISEILRLKEPPLMLKKPFTPSELVQLVTSLAERSRMKNGF